MSQITFDDQYQQEHNISVEFGFLSPNSLMSLPLDNPMFAEYEGFCSIMHKHIISGKFRERMKDLPQIDVESLGTKPMLERVMLMLCLLGHAFLHGNHLLGERPIHVLPKNIAVPWWAVSQKLGRHPALSHASIVLNNWMYLDKHDKTFSLENIGNINGFLQGIDEHWFYLIAMDIEYKAAKGIQSLLNLIRSVNENTYDTLEDDLTTIKSSLSSMTESLTKMSIHNSPYIFYNRVRTYVSAWERGSEKFPNGVIYEGVDENPHFYLGGTGAQSSTLHVFDEFFQIKHKNKLLESMREYMPVEHRSFIQDVSHLGQ
jgi:indoleamine 2,3-dioxygenase